MKEIKTLKKLIRHPLLLGTMLIVSIYAYFESEKREQEIASGFPAKVCADTTQKVVSTLRKIVDKEDPQKYLLFAKGLTDKVEFSGRSIPNNTMVTVLDTLESYPEVLRIYIHRENPTSINPRNEYLLIWEGYLCYGGQNE